jgi:hypothetical protein
MNRFARAESLTNATALAILHINDCRLLVVTNASRRTEEGTDPTTVAAIFIYERPLKSPLTGFQRKALFGAADRDLAFC